MKNTLTHFLSFDVEEYFQVEAAAANVRREDWDSFERRLTPCVGQILELLARYQTSATFFILGWVAQREPWIVRDITAAGHEIACHGMNHQMIQRLTPEEFRNDLLQSRKTLEDISGKPVLGYRAPTFSLTRKTAWAVDVLSQCGFTYDSSIFPVHHDRYGVPDAHRFPFQIVGPNGGTLLEIPPLTLRALKINWPIGGGGYLRLFPARLVAAGLDQAEWNNQPSMIYLHPWEFDPEQPNLPMSRMSRFRHRVGLTSTETKLKFLLSRYSFSSVQTFLQKKDKPEFPTFLL